jgi:hypothetical protein
MKKIEYCNNCFRVVTDLTKGYLCENKINNLISNFGLARYRIFNCFHCKKDVSYLTIKDLIYFYEIGQWYIYFLKFDIEKILKNIYEINNEAIYILDFNEINIKIYVNYEFVNYNAISINSIEKIDENNYLFIIKWWDFLKLTPGYLGVKELFFFKVKKNNNSWNWNISSSDE